MVEEDICIAGVGLIECNGDGRWKRSNSLLERVPNHLHLFLGYLKGLLLVNMLSGSSRFGMSNFKRHLALRGWTLCSWSRTLVFFLFIRVQIGLRK